MPCDTHTAWACENPEGRFVPALYGCKVSVVTANGARYHEYNPPPPLVRNTRVDRKTPMNSNFGDNNRLAKRLLYSPGVHAIARLALRACTSSHNSTYLSPQLVFVHRHTPGRQKRHSWGFVHHRSEAIVGAEGNVMASANVRAFFVQVSRCAVGPGKREGESDRQ